MRGEEEPRKDCPSGQRAEYSGGSRGGFSTAPGPHERGPEVADGAAGSATNVALRDGDPQLWTLVWTQENFLQIAMFIWLSWPLRTSVRPARTLVCSRPSRA